MGDPQEVQEAVLRRYAELAVVATAGGVSCCGEGDQAFFGSTGYGEDELRHLPDTATKCVLGLAAIPPWWQS